MCSMHSWVVVWNVRFGPFDRHHLRCMIGQVTSEGVAQQYCTLRRTNGLGWPMQILIIHHLRERRVVCGCKTWTEARRMFPGTNDSENLLIGSLQLQSQVAKVISRSCHLSSSVGRMCPVISCATTARRFAQHHNGLSDVTEVQLHMIRNLQRSSHELA